jgi:transcriptional antiterminator NusG
MIEWYILYVHTRSENQVARKLQKHLPLNLYRVFIPYKERFFKKAGIVKLEKDICFPGYVFIESKTSSKEFLNIATKFIRSINEVYSILSYDNKNDIALNECEKQYLKRLLCNCDCIKASYGYIIDDIMHIKSGALVGMEKAIVKIERHKRLAKIEIMLFGTLKSICVALELTYA